MGFVFEIPREAMSPRIFSITCIISRSIDDRIALSDESKISIVFCCVPVWFYRSSSLEALRLCSNKTDYMVGPYNFRGLGHLTTSLGAKLRTPRAVKQPDGDFIRGQFSVITP